MENNLPDIYLRDPDALTHPWLAAIIHSSDDAIISKTLDGIVSSWNEGARRIFGYTAEEMIGQPILLLIPEDRLQEEPAILERLKRGERVDHFETKRVSKNGTLLDISLSISPIRDKTGRIIGASKIARNITAQKEAERIINEGKERFRQELEDTVRDRTQQLAESNRRLAESNIQLAESNARLAKSNYELEQFAYIASHDLQEPLRKIHVFSELLEEGLNKGADMNTLQKHLQKIKHASIRMSRLIKDVLEYSRLSRNELTYEPVDLNEVMRDVLMEFDLWVAEKKASVTVDLLPMVVGVASQFRQLFRNLIGNALKFSMEHPRIVIQAEKVEGFVKLSFKDNGIGFGQEHAAKIFDIFQRLNNQDKYGGSGIGLALCKKIVENHHGSISVVSEPGKGATFQVMLPA